MTKNDWKYVIKRVITYIAIAMIMLLLGSCNVKAATLGPDLLQYYNSSTISFTRNYIQQTKFGQNFYVSSTPSTISEVRAIYGISNNKISGSILSFSLQAGQPKPTISAQVQLVDSSFVNCDMETNTKDYADGTIYTAKCNIGTPQAIYKYGFMWQDSAGYNTSEGALLLTSINAFNSETDYTAYYNQLNSSINAASSQAHQDAQQAHQDAQQAHQDAQQINNSINDDTPPSDSEINSNTSEWSSNNSDNNVINNLVLMPISLLNSVVNGLSGTCSTYNIGELWGENLTLPCINLSNILGAVWSIIDVIMSGVFIFIFGKRCVKIFNDFTNLRSGQIDSLYGGGE